MSKLSVTEALKLVNVSKTTLYADIKKGVLSCEVDPKGRKRIDPAELQRVYSTLNVEQNRTPDLNNPEYNQTPKNTPENEAEIVSLLKSQVEQLQTEVTVAREREQKLLEIIKTEQQKTQHLMLPAPKKRKRSFRNIFRLT